MNSEVDDDPHQGLQPNISLQSKLRIMVLRGFFAFYQGEQD